MTPIWDSVEASVIFSSQAPNNTIEGDHNPISPLALSLEATFTVLSPGVLQIVLANNTVNQNVFVSSEDLSQIGFDLPGFTAGTITSVSGQLLTTLPGNTAPSPTAFQTVSGTPWSLTTSNKNTDNFLLSILTSGKDTAYGIIGPPGSGGTYTNTTSPFTGGGNYDQFISSEVPLFYKSATIDLSIPGLLASDLGNLSMVTFATGPDGPDKDDFVSAVVQQQVPSAPEPASFGLLGAGLCALGLLRRKEFRFFRPKALSRERKETRLVSARQLADLRKRLLSGPRTLFSFGCERPKRIHIV